MALFSSIFRNRGEKKEEAKTHPHPIPGVPPPAAQPVSAALPGKSPAGKTSAGAPAKPMQLDEIVAALQQIESIMGEPSPAAPAKTAAKSDRRGRDVVALSLSEIVQTAPSSFNDLQVSPGDKVDVLIDDLFNQMSKGKVETTLGYLLAGVPKQYLVNPADLESETKVLLPLPLVVAAMDPEEFKKRTAHTLTNPTAADLPNLFSNLATKDPVPAAQVEEVPQPKQDKFTTLSLKISDLRSVLPSAFKSASIPADAKVDVPVENVFGQLTRGRVEVPVNQLLAAVPKPYLSVGATLDAEVLISLPLAAVVAAVPSEELKKRTAEGMGKPLLHDLPDLFTRADTGIPPAASKASPPAPKIEPKASPAPEIKPASPAKTDPILKTGTVAPVKPPVVAESSPRPKIELKSTEKVEPKAEPKPVAPVTKAVPVIPVPKVAPTIPLVPKIPSIPVEKTVRNVQAEVSFSGPAPKKFMPMDLVGSAPVVPPPVSQPPAAKLVTEKPSVPVVPPRASASGIPALMLRGLDLNEASAEELVRVVDGIGEAMAQRIVEDRKVNGPFFGLYDLGRVSGIGSKVYEKITGQPWLEEKYAQLPLVDKLLGRWTGKHPDLKDVAAKFKTIPGFEGCMILHRDGDLLASSWQVDMPDRLQAMAPQILKKVKYYMRHIAQGETYSVTVFLEGVSFTFVESEDICFVAVQNPRGLSRRHIQIVNGLGIALGRRFSGYRGA